ncbi:hypothetical protein [Paracoccus beibuensis]|uniref:hypothetical protein n=1 Tax=Paracoccus beibuensis TaxID=547602 RepID=UPI0022405016|nr:hypothetical protein [Paracoccus beibuensis]
MFTDLRIFRLNADRTRGAEIAISAGGDYGITQSLDPIGGDVDMRYDVNGELIIVENPLFRKYEISISARNMAAPALGGLWRGTLIQVWSIQQLTHTTRADGTVYLDRSPVPGSIDARTASGASITAALELDGRTVTAPGSAVVHYRPILNGALAEAPGNFDEDGGQSSWSLTLKEL